MKKFFDQYGHIPLTIGLMVSVAFAMFLYEKYILIPNHEAENPRLKLGKDIIETSDSTYYIRFQIDSAIENERPPEDDR